MTIVADLHLHSCLSPCGELDNSPLAIAATAKRRGLDLIALTDHNSALNAPAFAQACRRLEIAALFGLEVTTREEVHVLCLFEDPGVAQAFGEELYPLLPPVRNDPEHSGDQVYVDVDEQILGAVEHYLVSAISWSLEETLFRCHDAGGLFIPAHIDRSVNSIWSQLGFLPAADFDAVEVTKEPCPLDTRGYTAVTNSDAHFLEDIAARSFSFEGEKPSFAALRKALADGAVSAACRRRRFPES